jgi:hypothetical protein
MNTLVYKFIKTYISNISSKLRSNSAVLSSGSDIKGVNGFRAETRSALAVVITAGLKDKGIYEKENRHL